MGPRGFSIHEAPVMPKKVLGMSLATVYAWDVIQLSESRTRNTDTSKVPEIKTLT